MMPTNMTTDDVNRSFPNEKVLVHIGLQKTSSTFLQHSVWPLLYPEMIRKVHGLPKVRMASNLALDLLGRMEHETSVNIPFISCEKLSGRLQPKSPGESYGVFTRLLEALNKANPKPKIIIFLRPQDQWLRSAYLYLRKEGRREGFARYLQRFNENDLSWYQRVKDLRGADIEVLGIEWEEWLRNPPATIKNIQEFSERSVLDADVLKALNGNHQKKNVSPKSCYAVSFATIEARLRKFIERVLRIRIGSRFQDCVISILDHNSREKLELPIPDEMLKRLENDYRNAVSLCKTWKQ